MRSRATRGGRFRGRSSIRTDGARYGHLVVSSPCVYVNVLFGLRMFFWKPANTRAGTLFLRIVLNVSRLRITSRRELTQRLSAVFPCLIPMPYGSAEELVRCQLQGAVGRGDADEDGVVPHERVGTPVHGTRAARS